ncbi:MAG: ricin-type beta-trefoil lectin domain protein [Paracoccaceae bacterium]
MKINILTGLGLAALLGSTSAQAESVEVTLIDNLDGVTNSFCLDIAGGNENVDPSRGLQAHTCYSYRGSLGDDQVFDTTRFAEGVLYMPVIDVCATVDGTAAGTKVGLAACDGSAAQSFVFAGTGTITPAAAPEMCLTVSGESRFGRSDVHQIRDLSLEACSDDLATRQQWRTRATDD